MPSGDAVPLAVVEDSTWAPREIEALLWMVAKSRNRTTLKPWEQVVGI